MSLSTGVKKTGTICLLSAVLITTIPIGLVHAAEANPLASLPPKCDIDYSKFVGDLGEYAKDYLFAKGGLFAIDITTSLLEKVPYIGGAFEPIDQTVDELETHWNKAFIWGIYATFASWLTGKLVLVALWLNTTLTSDAPFVKFGYGLILGIVNVALIISLIIVAFGVMLRRSKWATQGTVARIIIAALLINFTMFFAGTVLNAGTALTNNAIVATEPCLGSFVNKFNVVTINSQISNAFEAAAEAPQIDSNLQEAIKRPDTLSWWDKIKAAFNPQTYAEGVKGAVMKVVSAFLQSLFSIYIASLLAIISALTFAALFVFLVVRYAVLSLLLIFAPLIWLGLIFPGIKLKLGEAAGNPWGWWWGQFLKWSLYGPLIVFSIAITSRYLDFISQGGAADSNSFVFVAQLFIAVIFSLGGLYAALKMGAMGSEYIGKGVSAGVGFVGKTTQGFWMKQKIKYGEDSIRGKIAAGFEKASSAKSAPMSTIMSAVGLAAPKEDKAETAEAKRKFILSGTKRTPKIVLQLSNSDINEIVKSGTQEDRQKVDNAIAALANIHLGPKETIEHNRLNRYITSLTNKGEW